MTPDQQQAWNNANALLDAGQGLVNNVWAIKQNQAEERAQQASEDAIRWQEDFSEEQFSYQKYWAEKMHEYQKELNNLVMQREDTAIQRRAADLSAAGLNPNLAVGQPAQSQGFGGAGNIGAIGNNIGARHVPNYRMMNAQANIDMRMRLAQLGQMYAQNELLSSQQKYYESLSGKVDAETSVIPDTQNELRARSGYFIENGKYIKEKAIQLEHDIEIELRRGIRSNDSGYYGLIYHALNSLSNSISSFRFTDKPLVEFSFGDGLKSVFNDIGNAIKNGVPTDKIVDSLKSALSKAKSNLGDSFSKAKQGTEEIWESIMDSNSFTRTLRSMLDDLIHYYQYEKK